MAKSTFSASVAGRPFSIFSANAKKILLKPSATISSFAFLFFFGLVHHAFAVFFSRGLFIFLVILEGEPFEFFFGCHRHFPFRRRNRLFLMCRLMLEDGLFLSALNSTDVLSGATDHPRLCVIRDLISFSENPKYL